MTNVYVLFRHTIVIHGVLNPSEVSLDLQMRFADIFANVYEAKLSQKGYYIELSVSLHGYTAERLVETVRKWLQGYPVIGVTSERP